MERVYGYCILIDFQHTSLTFRIGSYYKKGFLKIEQKQENTVSCFYFLKYMSHFSAPYFLSIIAPTRRVTSNPMKKLVIIFEIPPFSSSWEILPVSMVDPGLSCGVTSGSA